MRPLLGAAPATPIRPGPDSARTWLTRELGRPEYHQSLLLRLVARVHSWWDQLRALALSASPLSAGAAVALALALVVVVALAAARVRREPSAGRPAHEGDLLDGVTTAQQHRAAAEEALSSGHLDLALVEAFRALATGAVETNLVEDRPGLTARELTTELGDLLPEERAALTAAADRFDVVFYGAQDVTVPDVRAVLDLHASLRRDRHPPRAAQRQPVPR